MIKRFINLLNAGYRNWHMQLVYLYYSGLYDSTC